MYCRYCGKEIPDDARFCCHCGKNLDGSVEVKLEKKVDVEYNKFKNDCSKGALTALIWFASLNILASLFLVIGYIIAISIFVTNYTEIEITYRGIMELMAMVRKEPYFIIVPIMYTVGYLIASAIAIFIGFRVSRKGEEEKPLRNIYKLTIGELLLVIISAFGLWGAGVIIGNLPSFFYENGGSEAEIIFGNHVYIYLIQAIICAPIFEELVFRKLFIDKVAKHGEGLAIVTSALLFGLVHGNLGQFFLAFFVGILFGIVYIKTRNILYTMLLHFIINTFASAPEIFGIFNIDITVIWYIVALALFVSGVIMMIAFRKKEIFKINKECRYDGYLIHRSTIFEVLFIILLVLLGSQALQINIIGAINSSKSIGLLSLLELIPIGGFVAVIILYNKIVHKVLRKKEESEEISL